MKKILFCSFATAGTISLVLSFILSNFRPVNDRVFIYQNYDIQTERIITYNCILEKSKPIENVICIHRKKDSNTFYTINALNVLIKTINNNVLDTSYPIDWHLYTDMLLTTKNSELVKTKLIFLESKKI